MRGTSDRSSSFLDDKGNPLKGFEAASCVEIKTDTLTRENDGWVSWKTEKDLRRLQGQTILLRFTLANAKLYSEMALKQKLTELRGYMFTISVRRIQLVQKTNACESAGHFAGLYQCTARAQLCGH